MAHAVLTSSDTKHALTGITARLRQLRTRIWLWFFVDGFSRLLAAAVLLVGLDLLVDWTFEMDVAQRIVMMSLIIVCLVALAVWRIVRPLMKHLTDEALCLQVEQQHAELGESLISALQFSRMENVESRGVSQAMVTATIERGLQSSADVLFDDVLRRDRFLWNTVLMCAAMLAIIGVGVGTQAWEPLKIWFDRNVMLREDVSWPQDTTFLVDGVQEGELVIPRGDDWLLIAHVNPASKVFPDAAEIEIRRNGQRRSEVMKAVPVEQTKQDRSSDDSGRQRMRFEYPFTHVVESFEFRIISRSGKTPWIPVTLIDRPEVQSLELSLHEPDYAGGKTVILDSGRGPHYVLKGSRLNLKGTSSKELAQAELLIGGVTIALQHDGKAFQGTVPADIVVAETYRIRLVDTQRIQFPNTPTTKPLESNPHTRFELRIRPDRKPKLTLKLRGIGGMVVPGAVIPSEVRVADDYSITAARLKHEFRHRDEEKPTAGGDPLQPVNEALKNSQPTTQHTFTHRLELKPLQIRPGSSFSFRFEADDNDTISGPNTGSTLTMTIRVVTEDELRSDLLRREKEQRQEFQRLLNEQDKLYTETQSILAEIRGKTAVPAEARNRLRDIQKQQGTLGKNLAGIADKLASIVEEFRNNRIEADDSPLKDREDNIIAPMRDLAEKAAPAVVAAVTAARKSLTTPAPRDKSLTAAVTMQQKMIDIMRKILSKMQTTENFQELVNQTYRILKEQQQVSGMTDAEIKELLRKRFGSKPSFNPTPKKN